MPSLPLPPFFQNMAVVLVDSRGGGGNAKLLGNYKTLGAATKMSKKRPQLPAQIRHDL
jgi:hypothetical protein